MKTKNKSKIDVFTLVLMIFLIAYALSMLFMLAWGAMTSFKSINNFDLDSVGFLTEFTFENYTNVITNLPYKIIMYGKQIEVGFGTQLYNTLVTVVGGALLATLSPCIMAYCSAIYPCKFSSLIYWIVLTTMMLPIVSGYASEMQLVRAIGMFDNLYASLIFKLSFLGMNFLIFRAAFKSVGKEYFEAAKIDGANDYVIFFRIILPLVRNMFFTIFLLKFILFWNDYQTPLLYLPTHPTLSLGAYDLRTNTSADLAGEPAQMAICMIMMIPVLVLFISFRKMIMGNISMGGVKE